MQVRQLTKRIHRASSFRGKTSDHSELGVAILGTSDIARGYVRQLRKLEQVTVDWVFSRSSERAEKLLLLNRALNSLTLLAHGTVALMVLRAQDFTETGTDTCDTERFVDIPQIVGRVQTVALITEPPSHNSQGPIRVSFRSKPGLRAVNVAELANQFGGGGHARAAGAHIEASFEEVVARVTEVLSSI